MEEEKSHIAYVEKKYQYKIEKEPDESISFFCDNCGAYTSHKTIVRANVCGEDGIVSVNDNYYISECSGCHTIRFVVKTLSPDDDSDLSEDDYYKDFSCYIYPEPEEKAMAFRYSNAYVLPDRIRQVYEETASAFRNKMFILAGMGLRTILDMVCRDNKIGNARTDLFKRLQIMYEERHLITEDEKEILDAIRDLGNNSAHEGKPLTFREIQTALIVVGHIFDKLYLIPRMKNDFKIAKHEKTKKEGK